MIEIGKYYYFKLRNGVEYAIKESPVAINTEIMRMYRELTDAQREFYLQNRTATVQEVVNCELTPPYVPPAPDLQDYIEVKTKELKSACLGTMTVTTVEYCMANAVLAGTALTYTGARHYTTVEAKAVMKQFMDESHTAMTVLETYAPQMEIAQSIEAVDLLFNEALAQL